MDIYIVVGESGLIFYATSDYELAKENFELYRAYELQHWISGKLLYRDIRREKDQ